MDILHLLVSFITLAVMEIVLGIDNIVFVGIISDQLPEKDRPKARQLGLLMALLARVGFLCLVSLLTSLTDPVFTVLGRGFAIKDLVLLVGGLFLLYKATTEIHAHTEGKEEVKQSKTASTVKGVIGTIMLMDIIFSIDSVVTAVGMVNNIPIMVAAVVVAMLVMVYSVNSISDFISHHPTVKMLALAFLLLIGFALTASSVGAEIEKGYIYFAMGFSVFVEMLNMRARKNQNNVSISGG